MPMTMRVPILLLAALTVAGCTTAFWDRPGATRLTRAQDTEECYRRALDTRFPAALPGPVAGGPGVPADQPPPALWQRSPAEAGFVTFDQEQRYEQCMRELGYHSTRPR
jgi:hypothetical protein